MRMVLPGLRIIGAERAVINDDNRFNRRNEHCTFEKGKTKMQFLIRAYDGEGKLEKRMEVRPRHLEGMKALNSHIISAGGLLEEDGRMKGSALIMDFESMLDIYKRLL